MNDTLSAKKLSEKAITEMIRTHPFYAHTAMCIDVIEDDQIPTACTDGKTIRINPNFCKQKSEMVAVIMHEIKHIEHGHLWRMGDRDPYVWNQACDHFVNLDMESVESGKRNFTWPEELKDSICKDPSYKGMAEEKIYNDLMKKKGQGKGGGSGGQGGQGEGQSSPGKPKPKPGMGDFVKVTGKKEVQGMKEKLYRASKSVQAGDLPGHMKEMLKEMTNPAPSLREIIWAYIVSFDYCDYSFHRQNPVYADSDLIMPDFYSEKPKGKVLACIDSSASVDDKMASEFINVLQNGMDEGYIEELCLLQADTRVTDEEEYFEGDQIKFELKGRGGTDFRPAIEKFRNENIRFMLYLTDLEGPFPKEPPPFDVIWLTKKAREVPFGQVFEI